MKPNSSVVIIIITIFFAAYIEQVSADCKECKKLRRSPYLGIKKVKEYVLRSEKISTISSERKARKQGLRRFKTCTSTSKVSAVSCKPVFALLQDNIYFCPKQLRAFKTESQAQGAGYAAYTACGVRIPTPTPTSTPQVSPQPLTRSFSIETGTRFSDVDSISIDRLSNGSYRSYLANSADSLNPDTLYSADSADGLSFAAKTAITGIVPEALETFAYPAFVILDSGNYLMIYPEIKHISSAGLDIANLRQATSADGNSFSYASEFAIFPGGSTLASNIQPSLIRTGATGLRAYYSVSSLDTRTLTSRDEGVTWDEPQNVSLMGRSDSLAPYPGDHSVIYQSSNAKYLMFFVSPRDINSNGSAIFMADSSDGINFVTFDQAILIAPSGVTYSDPAGVILADGSIRVYFIERSGDLSNLTRVVKSALSM